ncbi:hypothetical protein [Caulobacter sp. Root343]|uniref:hypothetical protein n=1 Tax=Caulobacter sp. Root343 TaxID=1736520 RepID=UPI0006FB362E|nr:hypothetical protein [Caulobacter sp. Root343]KQV66596.1 hypothetical protein ASC70_12240 [Caulobacter sp. Root343]
MKIQHDFALGMSSIKTSAMLLGVTDWQAFLDQVNFAEGAGAVLNPSTFLAIQRDPQFKVKVRLAKAAQVFLTEYHACAAEILAQSPAA